MKGTLKQYLLIGIGIFVPAYITILIIAKIVVFFDSIMAKIIVLFNLGDSLKFLSYTGMGVVFSFIFFILLGFISKQYFGKKILTLVDRLFTLFPISREVYGSVKKLADSLIDKDKTRFKKVVMVPFPHRDVYAIGFLTSDAPVTKDGKRSFYVYVPTAINPTSGFLISVSEDQVLDSDLKVEDAFALILSGGMANPKKGDLRGTETGVQSPENIKDGEAVNG